MNPLIILGLAGLTYILILGKRNILNQLSFSINNIIPDFINLRLKIILNIINPLPLEIPITSIIGNISVNNKIIAEYSNSEGFVLKNGINNIQISAFPLFSNVISASKDILKGQIVFSYTITSKNLSYSDKVFIII